MKERDWPVETVLLVLMGCFLSGWSSAQVPTTADCAGAIPVCETMYIETAPMGDGNFKHETDAPHICVDKEGNSKWYTFSSLQSGELGFLITPDSPEADYDWAVFDITDASCFDIGGDPALLISCNAAGGTGCLGTTGPTGNTDYSVQGSGCFNSPPTSYSGETPHNARIPVDSGRTFIIHVANWSGGDIGYTLDFSPSIGLDFTTLSPPQITILFPEETGGDSILLRFNKPIQCSSISASDFRLTGPTGFVYALAGASDCDFELPYIREYVLNISPPLGRSGVYNFESVWTDSSHLVDLCGAPSAAFAQTFSVQTTGTNSEPGEKRIVEVYPNPADEKLFLSFGRYKPKEALIILRNYAGQAVKFQKLDQNDHEIDLSGIPSGMIVYEIYAENRKIKTGKLVKVQ